MDPRTRILLEAPIGRTILRLALPNIVVMGIQAAIGLVETYFIAKLGTDALAGLALVFPVQMLFVMITAGAMGGGILSAVARALGAAPAGRCQRAGLAGGLDRARARASHHHRAAWPSAPRSTRRWAGRAVRSRRR